MSTCVAGTQYVIESSNELRALVAVCHVSIGNILPQPTSILLSDVILLKLRECSTKLFALFLLLQVGVERQSKMELAG